MIEAMDRSTAKGRKFLSHLSTYVVVIGALFLINLLTSGLGEPWFLFPAIGWGIGLAFHLFSLVKLDVVGPRWQKFIGHLGSYTIVIGALFLINLLTSGLS